MDSSIPTNSAAARAHHHAPPVALLLVANPPGAAWIRDLLAATGAEYEIREEVSVHDAVHYAERQRFDLCLIDSPDGDESAVALATRFDHTGHHFPIIALTTIPPQSGANTTGSPIEYIPRGELTPYFLREAICWSIERHKLAGQARAGDERLQLMAASAPVIVFAVDRNGIFTMAAGKGLVSLGISSDALLGESVFELYAEEERIPHNIRRALAGETFDDIVRVGSLIYECRYAPLLDAKGVEGVIGIATDLTDQIRNVEELSRSERRFHAIWESAVDAMVLILDDGTIADANSAAIQWIGRTREEVIGTSFLSFFPAQLRERAFRRYRELFRNTASPPSLQFPLLRGDGERRIVEGRSNFIETEEGKPALVAILRDVTERERIARALRESEEYFRLLTENALDIITVLEPDGTIRYQSPALERVLGFKPEELIGQNAFSYIHPDDLPMVLTIFLEAIAIPGRSDGAEFRFLNSRGEWQYLESIGTNLIEHPAIRGVVLNSRDITERKLSEAALKEAHDKLEIRVRERTAEIVEMMARLEQAHEMQKGFVANASHDLRTPLTVIGIEIDLLLQAAGFDRETREIFLQIKKQTGQLEQLADDLLLLTSLDSPARHEPRTPIRLDELLLECVSKLNALAREKDISWNLSLDKGVDYSCEVRPIESALRNILENAIKYSPNGGMVEIDLKETGEEIRLTATDNGIGISEEDIDRVFDRFYRSDRTRTTPGTGLGLSIAKAAVEAHKGTVAIESELGSWTRIIISLPK